VTVSTRFLTIDDLLVVAARINQGEPAVRDLGLLESAVARSRTSAFGEDAYPELETKAAALMESIVRNRALVDGNRRLGWLATVLFLAANGIRLDAPDDEAYATVIEVAEGRTDVHEIAVRIREWIGDS
jgi:death-on-curing protein